MFIMQTVIAQTLLNLNLSKSLHHVCDLVYKTGDINQVWLKSNKTFWKVELDIHTDGVNLSK